jgi:GT2 family glycosyltransferase
MSFPPSPGTLPRDPDQVQTATLASRTPGRFTGPEASADAVVIVITYNSARDIVALLDSLRPETEDLTLRVLVADNASSDGTLALVRDQYPDTVAFTTGGNVGYSAGINAALLRAGDADAVVVLNPDLTVQRGSLKRLKHRLREAHAGVVVPLLLHQGATTLHSLHREPSISRALGDAMLGRRMPHRPGWLAGTDYDPESYAHAHTVEWATGAALMVRRSLADRLEWDETYFLYSEETDFFRRVRMLGSTIWYEPTAVMTHIGGGSGSSPQLNALLSVNRIRYVRKYHSSAYAAVFHSAVVFSESLRCWKPERKGVLRTVLDEDRWSSLPGPSREDSAPFPSGAVIIPAHNEAIVISRALAPLASLAASRQIEIIVVCNGCTDKTAQIARSFEGVTVLEIDQASKPAALNAGDAAASRWPRLYMDADVQIGPTAVGGVFKALSSGGPLAARPVVRYDLRGAHPLIHSYYRTRLRLPSARNGLWAGGVYALSEQGRQRFKDFPDLTSDDLFVDRLFAPEEKVVLDGEPVVFRPPRTLKDQLAVLHRVNRGNAEQNGPAGEYSTARSTFAEVLRSIRGPLSAANAAVYLGFAVAGRQGAMRSRVWERDESSRRSDEGETVRS